MRGGDFGGDEDGFLLRDVSVFVSLVGGLDLFLRMFVVVNPFGGPFGLELDIGH